MLTSQRLLKPAANYGNPLRTFQECFASPSCPTRRELPLWCSPPIQTCLLLNARHHRLQALLDGTSSTQLTLTPDSTSDRNDPDGAAIVVFTPNPNMPSPQRPASPTPGTIGWHELYTTDLDAGFDFYNKLFGWTKVSDMDMGPMGLYRIFDEGDHKQMGDGGMMTKAPQIPVSCWSFYFNVDSIKAAIKRVESGGGKVMNGPMQVPGGSWIINGQDPQGAMFSLVSNKE